MRSFESVDTDDCACSLVHTSSSLQTHVGIPLPREAVCSGLGEPWCSRKRLRPRTNTWFVLSRAPQIFPAGDSLAKCLKTHKAVTPCQGFLYPQTFLDQTESNPKKKKVPPHPSDHNDYFHKDIQMFNFFSKRNFNKTKTKVTEEGSFFH